MKRAISPRSFKAAPSLLLCLGGGCIASQATAQQVASDPSVRELPRPGLDAPPLRLGAGTLRLAVDSGVLYDSNVYAKADDARDDFSIRLRPTADFTLTGTRLDVTASARADVLEHLKIGRESGAEFGGALGLELKPASDHALSTTVQFDRLIESRADPDARAPILSRPRKINDFSGQVGYRYTGGNLRFAMSGTARKVAYLDFSERDRNHRAYQGTARISWAPRGATALYVEGYAVRRDFDLPTDFNGVDRDATTYGINVGVSREVTGRLSGSVGAGFFHFNPDDAALENYNGLGFSGRLSWRPRVRTAVTLSLFRGDVATVRSGAMGRTDTRVSLHLDQEVRHNLVIGATATWTANNYRGAALLARDTYVGSLEAEFLLAPRFSLFGTATVMKRDARETPTQILNQLTDDFSKAQVQLGLRLRF